MSCTAFSVIYQFLVPCTIVLVYQVSAKKVGLILFTSEITAMLRGHKCKREVYKEILSRYAH